MSSREQTTVKQIHLTKKQMDAAIRRATANSKYWVKWKDPKAEIRRKASVELGET